MLKGIMTLGQGKEFLAMRPTLRHSELEKACVSQIRDSFHVQDCGHPDEEIAKQVQARRQAEVSQDIEKEAEPVRQFSGISESFG